MKESRDPHDWWRRATLDAKLARRLFDDDPDEWGPWIWTACQQAGEKMLKAYLISVKKKFGRTHDLAELGQKAASKLPEIAPLLPSLVELTSGYLPSRYPYDSAPPFRSFHAKRAIEILEELEVLLKPRI